MKKIVISGSTKLRQEINYWINFFESRNYEVLDYPKKINKTKFMEIYPNVHKEFFENITKADILFIMNENKDGKIGYIGSETFAELTFGLAQNLIYHKKIELLFLQMPGEDIYCYEEIKLWLSLGWIKLYDDKI